jgi:hypothetical protein
MESKEYDFTRNPVVQNEVFFLESKCASCGFRFWHAQLTNWSNKKQRTELCVGGGQTLLHDGTRMRAFPTAGRLMISIFHGTGPYREPCISLVSEKKLAIPNV